MGRNRRRYLALAVACAAIASWFIPVATGARASALSGPNTAVPAGYTLIPAGSYAPLPLGARGLAETRDYETLAPGVTLTRIVRGAAPAAPAAINTTPDGPWIVNLVTIDPRKAKGHLTIVRGRYLTSRATVGALVAQAGGLAGINASFFDIDDGYGDPDALDIDNGQLVGNPGADIEIRGLATGPVIDSATNKLVLNGTYSWSGTVENAGTGRSLTLTKVDKLTAVPSACAGMTDQARCPDAGDLVRFDPVWGARTPAGHGVEVVLDARGTVVSVRSSRGTALRPGQTSLQATGSTAAALLSLVRGGGALKTTLSLYNGGAAVRLTPGLQAGTGSEILIDNGVNENPEPDGDAGGSRNPETAVATTRNGDIILFTVEGRATSSVGVNFREESAVLASLGAWNAEGLDGGGSTQLVADGRYVTASSDGTERTDGDAIVWVP